MKGTILSFDTQTQSGLIAGEDGQRYPFSQADWKNAAAPRNGNSVDFSINDGKANEIYRTDKEFATSSSKKWPAVLLAFLFGTLGAHKFYLGYKKQGIIMLLCFFPGMFLFVPVMVSGLIGFIEFILYLVKSDDEFEKTYVIGKKPWF